VTSESQLVQYIFLYLVPGSVWGLCFFIIETFFKQKKTCFCAFWGKNKHCGYWIWFSKLKSPQTIDFSFQHIFCLSLNVIDFGFMATHYQNWTVYWLLSKNNETLHYHDMLVWAEDIYFLSRCRLRTCIPPHLDEIDLGLVDMVGAILIKRCEGFFGWALTIVYLSCQ
jgi:hypothetical protein